jgi:hypothetical protein
VATARERLLQALTAIISQPFSEEVKASLKRLLNSYRVQAKPEENVDKNLTARDALANIIIHSWQQKKSLERKDVIVLIEPFRMQLKTGLNKRKSTNSDSPEIAHEENDSGSLPRRVKIKENINRHENAYFREKTAPDPKEQSAIAGGPLPKTGGRGQCPKCRSVGIVLARAYGGDDYYSCIYCGYQAYLKSIDPKLDPPLAAELLGSNYGDSEFDKED